ncbi:hypothetical protein PTTG_25260 [Puccinia triticina 1-1 BBBD Race 1]|uniref:Uncharacterized protein n=1 Tax=Puccinia triticina (isolate 1-1 / race 1 (BBBD)) TaxID=630390 RepID=A0A180H3X8_PUCT1|nr:hypothetical protein PTTG_25260 [Puccinia triticina 1-1 BBBD Race 1]
MCSARPSSSAGPPSLTSLLARLCISCIKDGPDFSKPPASVETLQLAAESQRAAHMILRLNDQVVAAFVTSHLQPTIVRQAVAASKDPNIAHCLGYPAPMDVELLQALHQALRAGQSAAHKSILTTVGKEAVDGFTPEPLFSIVARNSPYHFSQPGRGEEGDLRLNNQVVAAFVTSHLQPAIVRQAVAPSKDPNIAHYFAVVGRIRSSILLNAMPEIINSLDVSTNTPPSSPSPRPPSLPIRTTPLTGGHQAPLSSKPPILSPPPSLHQKTLHPPKFCSDALADWPYTQSCPINPQHYT